MAVALEQFVKQLEDSGIIAPGKLKEFIPPNAQPKDAEGLARELIKQNVLTKFQAQHVIQGKAKALFLGNYTILDRIGAGGMGQVFKAEHRRMKRVVALKMLPPAVTKDAAAVARFQREVEAASKLLHPNIVSAFDADEANGGHFLVMEYVEGKDLSATVKKSGPLRVSQAVHYILQAARGLEFAHKKGVIHRDIKPANLLVDSEGTVKILDMGLARIESPGEAQAELTGSGAVMGTVDYMSPEQAFNTKHADARADIYSLGCSLYFLLAGKATYGGETVVEKILAHRDKPIPSLAEAQEGVPEQLEAVFRKMVAKQIEERYQTMSEVVAELENCQAGMSAPSVTLRRVDTANIESDLSIAFGQSFLPSIPNSSLDMPIEPPKRRKAGDKAAEKASDKSGNGPPWKNKKVLIGAGGAAGFLALVLGVIVILRNDKGEEVGRLELAPGTTVEVVNHPADSQSTGSDPTSRDRKGLLI